MSIDNFTRIIIKYKLLHIAFWIYATISLVHLVEVNFGSKNRLSHIIFAINVNFFRAICVYTLTYRLVPKFLNQKLYLKFILYSLGVIIITSLLSTIAEDLYQYIVNGKRIKSYYITMASRIYDTIALTSVFLAVIIIASRYQIEKRTNTIEKERLKTELNFLKLQINPHFLFNALNSIYVLIDVDKKLASNTLLKFSALLRYQLYECGDKNYVDVERELDFLNDYVSLEKLRNGENIHISFKRPDAIHYFPIAPFLLIPFVENAFKHISHFTDRENSITIEALLKPGAFQFIIRNTYEEKKYSSPDKIGGIGLQNVYRRLELLYPTRHRLDLTTTGNIFTVNLTIYANENELHHS